MQYLLTEEEYSKIKCAHETTVNILTNQINCLCQRIADTEPFEHPSGIIEPYKCIKSIGADWYCDNCPVQQWCRYEYKRWSK